MLKPVDAILTHALSQWRQMRKSHSDAVEITLMKQVSLVGIRHSNGAKPEEAFLLWRHDKTANALFSFLAASDFKMATPLI